MLVTAINRTNGLLLVGDRYLFPGEGRRVLLDEYLQARRQHGAGLESPDANEAAVVLLDALDEAAGPAAYPGAETVDDEPDEYSLDVLDGDVDERDLQALSRAELAEMARRLGITPSRMSKREMIDAIQACE